MSETTTNQPEMPLWEQAHTTLYFGEHYALGCNWKEIVGEDGTTEFLLSHFGEVIADCIKMWMGWSRSQKFTGWFQTTLPVSFISKKYGNLLPDNVSIAEMESWVESDITAALRSALEARGVAIHE